MTMMLVTMVAMVITHGNNGNSKQKQMYREIVYNDHYKLYILIVPLLLLIVMADRISRD